jgi:methionyl aminopeptidase
MLASRTFRTAILNAYCRHPTVDCRPLNILSPRPARLLSSRYTTVSTASSGADLSELDDESFGIYSVILPPEPFVFGVSHIAQRPVPPHILRPPYVTPSSSAKPTSNSGDGRIQLGSSGERRLRSAARLARDVLEYAGTLVKVKTNRHCNPLTALTMR